MEKTLEQLLNTYKTNIIHYIRPHAQSLLEKGGFGVPCFIFYGNDQILMDIFVDEFICRMNDVSSIIKKRHQLYLYSEYHFEFDCLHDDKAEQIKMIKQLKHTRNITGNPHILHLKNMNIPTCKHLHHFIDMIKDNMIVCISSHRLKDIDNMILNHCEIVNLTPSRDQCKNFSMNVLQNIESDKVDGATINHSEFVDRFETAYNLSNGNCIQTILRMTSLNEKCNVEENIIQTLSDMQKTKSFMILITKIRDLSYKLYHLNIPFAFICKVILHEYHMSSKYGKLVEICAKCDHLIQISYKELFIYEKFFLEIYGVLKMRESIYKGGVNRKKV